MDASKPTRNEMSSAHTMRIFVARDTYKLKNPTKKQIEWRVVLADTGLQEFGYDADSIRERLNNLAKKKIKTAADYASTLAANRRQSLGSGLGGVRWSPYARDFSTRRSASEVRLTPPRVVSPTWNSQGAGSEGSQQEPPSGWPGSMEGDSTYGSGSGSTGSSPRYPDRIRSYEESFPDLDDDDWRRTAGEIRTTQQMKTQGGSEKAVVTTLVQRFLTMVKQETVVTREFYEWLGVEKIVNFGAYYNIVKHLVDKEALDKASIPFIPLVGNNDMDRLMDQYGFSLDYEEFLNAPGPNLSARSSVDESKHGPDGVFRSEDLLAGNERNDPEIIVIEDTRMSEKKKNEVEAAKADCLAKGMKEPDKSDNRRKMAGDLPLVVTPVSSRKSIKRSEVGTQTLPSMASPRPSQLAEEEVPCGSAKSTPFRRVRKLVPKWKEENPGDSYLGALLGMDEMPTGYAAANPGRILYDKEWKKVLYKAQNDKLIDLIELSAEEWSDLIKNIGISTTKSGRQIMKDFFSYVVPDLRSGFGKVGEEMTVGLQETGQLTMIAIFHRMEEATPSGVREVIGKMISEKLLHDLGENSVEFWYAKFGDALVGRSGKTNYSGYFNTSNEDYKNFLLGLLTCNLLEL